jgi:hypothetical protein
MAELKQNQDKHTALQYITTLYLCLAAVIGLICFIMGASTAVKLGLQKVLPYDETYYFAPYDKSPCEVKFVDGKDVKPSETEVNECVKRMEEGQLKQSMNNFNRQLTESIALTVVGFPVWLLHFILLLPYIQRKKS